MLKSLKQKRFFLSFVVRYSLLSILETEHYCTAPLPTENILGVDLNVPLLCVISEIQSYSKAENPKIGLRVRSFHLLRIQGELNACIAPFLRLHSHETFVSSTKALNVKEAHHNGIAGHGISGQCHVSHFLLIHIARVHNSNKIV